ncbi:MAG: 5-formyltetrahydrofolate cyclo-ligase [Prosthecobacter sp.]|nr:5-formyltetrahydrofolate cyclo-ligase [Prosthecobacter sp.]
MTPPTPDAFGSKAALRQQMRQRLKMLPESSLHHWSGQIVHALQKRSDLWAQPGTIALFGGLRSEPDLISTFLPWLQERGWRSVFFAVQGVELVPMSVTSAQDLRRGPLGVWEPAGGQVVPHAELDLILVPGLAFGLRDGTRLGRGGGFYDRLLSRPELARARRIAVAFHLQLLPDIPCEPHDIRVPEIITELDGV